MTVKVKSLEWTNHASENVWICRRWDFKITSYEGKFGVSPVDWPPFDMPYSSLEEAKSAAQEAHDKMILSAIDIT